MGGGGGDEEGGGEGSGVVSAVGIVVGRTVGLRQGRDGGIGECRQLASASGSLFGPADRREIEYCSATSKRRSLRPAVMHTRRWADGTHTCARPQVAWRSRCKSSAQGLVRGRGCLSISSLSHLYPISSSPSVSRGEHEHASVEAGSVEQVAVEQRGADLRT